MFVVLGFNKMPNQRDITSFVAAIIKFLIVISMAPVILSGHNIEYSLFTVMPGIEFKFRVDALGMVFATIASFLWILASVYSVGYMRSSKEHAQTRFFACFTVSIFAAVGGAFSANLFTLLVFYEVLSLATYPLVYHKETPESWAGSKKYIIYLVGTSKTFLLAAVVLTFLIAGNLDFRTSRSACRCECITGSPDSGLYLLSPGFCKGCNHAVPRMASCGNGGADPCQCAPACSGRR